MTFQLSRFKILMLTIVFVGATFATANSYSQSNRNQKAEIRKQVENNTYRFGQTYFYFSSNGSVYYGRKGGKIRHNFWNIRFVPRHKKLGICFVVNTVSLSVATRTTYCETPSKFRSVKVGKGDSQNLKK